MAESLTVRDHIRENQLDNLSVDTCSDIATRVAKSRVGITGCGWQVWWFGGPPLSVVPPASRGRLFSSAALAAESLVAITNSASAVVAITSPRTIGRTSCSRRTSFVPMDPCLTSPQDARFRGVWRTALFTQVAKTEGSPIKTEVTRWSRSP